MTKKKQLILDTARNLFNQKGFSQVTIRMIAQELNMSSGNLNYHFKKREEIFEALYFEMVLVFDERVENLAQTKVSIAQIRNDIEQSMHRMIDYQFFWTDLYNLLSVSDKVKAHFEKAYLHRIEGCFLLFEKLKQEGLMRSSSFDLEYSFLAERMVNFGNTWLYSSGLYSRKFDQKLLAHQTNSLLSMLYPFFSKKGQAEFELLLPDYFR
jgi:AcrR family transcriptional regulator